MDLLATEFLKLRTQRSMRMLLLVALLLTVAGFILFALGVRGAFSAELGLENEIIQRQMLGTGGLATLLILVFAIVGITTEYRHETITWAFLSTPRRHRVLLAKLVTYVIVAVVFGAIVSALITAGVVIFLQIENVALVVPWSTIWGDFGRDLAGLTVAACFGFTVGAIVINQVVSLAIIFAQFIISPIVMGLYPKVGKFLPAHAAASFLADQRFPGDGFLSAGMGALAIAIWIAVLLGVAVYLTQRRDIT